MTPVAFKTASSASTTKTFIWDPSKAASVAASDNCKEQGALLPESRLVYFPVHREAASRAQNWKAHCSRWVPRLGLPDSLISMGGNPRNFMRMSPESNAKL